MIPMEGRATNIHKRWGKVYFNFTTFNKTEKVKIPAKQFDPQIQEGDYVMTLLAGAEFLPDGRIYQPPEVPPAKRYYHFSRHP